MGKANALNVNDSGLIDFNSVNGQFTSTDLTTKGDLLGYTGSAHQRFAVGTDGYVLKADDTQAVGWRWGCPAFEFISSATASGSSTVEFTNFADDECFNAYKIVWQNVTTTISTNEFALRISTDNGSTWKSSGYQYARESIRDDTDDTVYPYSASDSFWEINGWTGGNPRAANLVGEMFLYTSPDPANELQQGFTTTSINHVDSSQSLTSRGWGIVNETGQINGLQFYINGGTLTTGNLFLYGMLL